MTELPKKAASTAKRSDMKKPSNMVENAMMNVRTKSLSLSDMVELSERRINCQI
jgi:hypothetical protein